MRLHERSVHNYDVYIRSLLLAIDHCGVERLRPQGSRAIRRTWSSRGPTAKQQLKLHSAKLHHQHPTLPYNVPRSQGTHPIQSELELQAGGTLVLHLNLAFSLGFGTGIRPPRLPRCDFRHSPPTPPLLSPRFLHVPSCSSCSCPKP